MADKQYLLSHYTTLRGLEGIARSKYFWASDFSEVGNDKNELIFGMIETAKIALRAATDIVRQHLLPEHRDLPLDIDSGLAALEPFFRSLFDSLGGSERLYMVCFAQAQDSFDDTHGLKSLWAEHQYKGYCLQFDRDEVLAILAKERSRYHYIDIDLIQVNYHLEDDPDFKEICEQLKLQYLQMIENQKPGPGIRVDRDRLWLTEKLARESQKFNVRNKCPFYKDEREVRVAAIPAKNARMGPFQPFTPAKKVHVEGARHYIHLAECQAGGIEPRRIIIGPEASTDIGGILSLFARAPEVLTPTFPLRSV